MSNSSGELLKRVDYLEKLVKQLEKKISSLPRLETYFWDLYHTVRR